MGQEKESVTLNISDLKNILLVIDYAADNGSFKGWNNIRNVLALRDKLEKFINQVTVNSEENVNKNVGEAKKNEVKTVDEKDIKKNSSKKRK